MKLPDQNSHKALIFNPYLNTLGGGEFYTVVMAEFLLKNNYQVEFAWNDQVLFQAIYKRFNFQLKNKVKINKEIYSLFSHKGRLSKKIKLTKDYQFIFYVSNGSIPWLFGQKNILHFQVPFNDVKGKSIMNQLKLKKIHRIICNSFFTKKYIDKEFKVNAFVVHPPLADTFFKLNKIKKENLILSVGRFDEVLNSKRQDVLIEVFKKMVNNGLKNWRLILIGGLIKESPEFKTLKRTSLNYPIKILTNLAYKELIKYYQKAKIYWHAAGYGANLDLHPERAEHFGISILESMAAGCTPIVYNGGGVKEIINHQNNGFLWQTKKQLEKITLNMINNEVLIKQYEFKSRLRSKDFIRKNFELRLQKLLSSKEA